MSAEWLTAVATAGTFVVIAASALAAIYQLRHMRAANQMSALNEIRHTIESRDFQSALRFIHTVLPARLGDPEVRRAIVTGNSAAGDMAEELRAAYLIANFFGNVGLLVRTGVVDRDLVCYLWSPLVIPCWEKLSPWIANVRKARRWDLWQNFEYLTVICQEWRASHPQGFYPAGIRRLPLPEIWPENSGSGDVDVP